MMVEPIFKAVSSICHSGPLRHSSSEASRSEAESRNPGEWIPDQVRDDKKKQRVILFSAKGKQFTQADARRLVEYDEIIMICGRYEGVDERVAQHIADEELSVGNFVLTGGEIPAMIVTDAVSRLIPGVLGNSESLKEESFSFKEAVLLRSSASLEFSQDKSLGTSVDAQFSSSAFGGEKIGEYPQYTRPEEFNDWKVPEILLSGDHKKIKEWRENSSKFKNQN